MADPQQSGQTPPIIQMVQDPDFAKAPLAEQQKALAAHDPIFAQAGPSDIQQFVQAHQAAPQTPAPAGLPVGTIGARPQPQGVAGKVEQWAGDLSDDIRNGTGQTLIGRMLQGMGAKGTSSGVPEATGNFMGSLPLGLARGLKGEAQIPQGKVWEGTKNIVGGGLQAATIPLSFAAPEAAEASSELPGILSGSTALKKAGQGFQEVMGAAKSVPVDVSTPGNTALQIQKLAESGGAMPKVIRDFVKRVTDPSKAPLTYEEARDFYSNASRLSADEAQRLTPVMKRWVGQFRSDLGDSISQAASQVGKGDVYQDAMQGYAQGMRQQDFVNLLKNAAVKTVKYGLPTGIGATAGGYVAGKALGLKK